MRPLHLVISKNPISVLLLVSCLNVSYSQDSIHLKQNAVKIDNPDSLGEDIYKLIATYQLIMIGEMHGTNEPAVLVTSLVDLLTKKNDSVQVGLEIPSEQMKNYLWAPAVSNICASDFFANKSSDGRATCAWATLIEKLNNNHKAEIFFYDINHEDAEFIDDTIRDSMMYVKIKKKIQAHPTWKTITLGGNIHNMLMPYKYDGKTKMALYISNDKELNISKRILSLVHVYAAGSTLSDSGNGLQLIQVDQSNSLWAKATACENYLFLYPQNVKTNYSGVYFTRKLTASKLLSER
jgi:hypothetical protein